MIVVVQVKGADPSLLEGCRSEPHQTYQLLVMYLNQLFHPLAVITEAMHHLSFLECQTD